MDGAGVGTQILSGTNTYSGPTIINGGVLEFANASALPAAPPSRSTPAERWPSWSAGRGLRRTRVNAFAIANSRRFRRRLDPRHGHHARHLLYPYTITGNMGLTKLGPNTLTLTAATNSYTGPTQVVGGSLVGTLANIPTPSPWPTTPT